MTGLGLYFDLAPALVLCVILGANNLSTCLGTSMGARTVRYSHALALASIGVLLGILLEGNKVSTALTTGIVSSGKPELTLDIAYSSILIMSLLTYRNLPISLSQVAVGAAVGAAIARGVMVNWSFTMLVASSWLLTPLVGFAVAVLLTLLTRKIAKRVKRVITLNMLYGYLTIFSGIYASYALGANTLGLIIGMVEVTESRQVLVPIALGLATVFGILVFSRGTTRSVAENIVGLSPSASFAAQMGGAISVHAFTQFGMPVSISQGVVGGILGAAMSRRIVVRNARLTREIILGWTVAPLLGAGLAFLIAAIL